MDATQLKALTREATEQALASGALQPIETTTEVVLDSGIAFLVHVVSSLARKERARQADPARKRNPFLPYEPELFVADLSPTHVCLLNKFPVFAHHVLLVTREFESQESELTEADFDALAITLGASIGLAFYNSGTISGASQAHKHLQVVPLPLAPQAPVVPMALLFGSIGRRDRRGSSPHLPFAHSLEFLPQAAARDRRALALVLLATYQAMRARHAALGWSGAYNLLVTCEWMLMVPRAAECHGTISVNALGFAGSLLVKDAAQLEYVRAIGPMQLLRDVTVAVGRA